MAHNEDDAAEPIMILHIYREADGTFVLSEQRYHNHSVRRTAFRRRLFQDFWLQLAEQLEVLEKDAHRLGWHLTEQLSYLRMLREIGLITTKKEETEE